MTDSMQSATRIQYIADGKQVEFYIPFTIFSPSDVEVYTNSVLQTDTYSIPWPEQQGRFRVKYSGPARTIGASWQQMPPRSVSVCIAAGSGFDHHPSAVHGNHPYLALSGLGKTERKGAQHGIRLRRRRITTSAGRIGASYTPEPDRWEAALLLPVKEERANKALVFDDQGNSDVCALPRQLSDISEDSRFRHFTAEQQTKLDGIEPAATADQTGTEIVAAINGELGGNGWQSSGVADNAVSNAKLADVASGTLKGRVSANTGDPEDLTAAQVRALLNVADGATAAGAAGDAFAASHPARRGMPPPPPAPPDSWPPPTRRS